MENFSDKKKKIPNLLKISDIKRNSSSGMYISWKQFQYLYGITRSFSFILFIFSYRWQSIWFKFSPKSSSWLLLPYLYLFVLDQKRFIPSLSIRTFCRSSTYVWDMFPTHDISRKFKKPSKDLCYRVSCKNKVFLHYM